MKRMSRAVLAGGIIAASVTGALAGCSSSDTSVAPTTASSSATSPPAEVKPPSTPESERALFDAVDRNDPAAITAALASGANIEARREGERTPLVEATKNDAVAAASTLILAGADVNAKDSMQDSAFLYSGAEGLNEILALTLAHGADVDSVNRYGGTALIPASEHAHVESVRMLIAAGVPVNHVNDPGWTALLEAVVYGRWFGALYRRDHSASRRGGRSLDPGCIGEDRVGQCRKSWSVGRCGAASIAELTPTSRAQPVGLSKASAEVSGVDKPRPVRNGRDRQIDGSGSSQFVPSLLQALGDDPLFDPKAVVRADLVQLSQ